MSDTWNNLPEYVEIDVNGIIYIRGDNLEALLKWTKEQIDNRGGSN